MSISDLIPFNKRTEHEQKKIQRKGGQKSGEVRREKKNVLLCLNALLEQSYDTPEGKVTGAELIASKLFNLGVQEGNIKALSELLDRVYGKAKQNVDVSSSDGSITALGAISFNEWKQAQDKKQ